MTNGKSWNSFRAWTIIGYRKNLPLQVELWRFMLKVTAQFSLLWHYCHIFQKKILARNTSTLQYSKQKEKSIAMLYRCPMKVSITVPYQKRAAIYINSSLTIRFIYYNKLHKFNKGTVYVATSKSLILKGYTQVSPYDEHTVNVFRLLFLWYYQKYEFPQHKGVFVSSFYI